MIMAGLFRVQLIAQIPIRVRRAITRLRRGRDGAVLWLVMLLILFVHPLLGETGDALDSAVWVFEKMGAVSGP